jgi:hypothetical protein
LPISDGDMKRPGVRGSWEPGVPRGLRCFLKGTRYDRAITARRVSGGVEERLVSSTSDTGAKARDRPVRGGLECLPADAGGRVVSGGAGNHGDPNQS